MPVAGQQAGGGVSAGLACSGWRLRPGAGRGDRIYHFLLHLGGLHLHFGHSLLFKSSIHFFNPEGVS